MPLRWVQPERDTVSVWPLYWKTYILGKAAAGQGRGKCVCYAPANHCNTRLCQLQNFAPLTLLIPSAATSIAHSFSSRQQVQCQLLCCLKINPLTHIPHLLSHDTYIAGLLCNLIPQGPTLHQCVFRAISTSISPQIHPPTSRKGSCTVMACSTASVKDRVFISLITNSFKHL